MSSFRFTCHFCRGPLRLASTPDTSGLGLSQEPAAWSVPSAQGGPGDTPEEGPASSAETDLGELQGSASSWTLAEEVAGPGGRDGGFTLLGRPAAGRSLGSIQRTLAGLWDVLCGEAPGHPLCEDCTDGLLAQLDTRLRACEADSLTYRRCGEAGAGGGEAAGETLRRELEALEREEAALGRQLRELEGTRDRAAGALRAARAETRALERREVQDLRDLAQLHWRRLELQDELCSLEARLRAARAQLARLQGTDAFRAAFAISGDGPVASINGCRLGRVPAAPVSWGEIGAAWGHAALLLAALARALGLRFQRYRLVPRGDRSCLRPLSGGPAAATELPLFRPGGRQLWDGRLDRAAAAFLDCAQQFAEAARRAEPGLRLPYRIHAERGLMEDPGSGRCFSVRTLGNTEQRWTRALRLLLTNFQWSLDWVSLRYRHR